VGSPAVAGKEERMLPDNDDRHANPSGLPDEGLVHEHNGVTVHIEKVPAPVALMHSEEGHELPDRLPGDA
jgi:hypothetical protein